MSLTDEPYSPDSYLRGQSPVKEDTGTGITKPSRQASNNVTVNDGHQHGISYGILDGVPVLNPEKTIIAYPFHGLVLVGTDPANVKHWQSGVWLLVIRGKELGNIFDAIAAELRHSTHKGKAIGTGISGKEEVDSVEIIPFPEGDDQSH